MPQWFSVENLEALEAHEVGLARRREEEGDDAELTGEAQGNSEDLRTSPTLGSGRHYLRPSGENQPHCHKHAPGRPCRGDD